MKKFYIKLTDKSLKKLAFLMKYCPFKLSYRLSRFVDGEKVLLATSPSIPHMVVTETHLLCVLTDQSVDQEHFVSEVSITVNI